MFDNPSLLLERQFSDVSHSELASCKRVLVVNFLADGYLSHLAGQYANIQFVGLNYNIANLNACQAQDNLELVCQSQLMSEHQFDGVIIYFPKSKGEFAFTLNNVLSLSAVDAPVWVVGDNKGGVKTCDKTLSQFCSKAKKINAAKHCALYQAAVVNPPSEFVLNDWFKHFDVSIGDKRIKVSSLPGVFSHGSLDIGTDLLLNNLAVTPNGQILDFGCGAGVIGSFLSLLNPQIQVTGLDVNVLAITSTERTFANNGVNGTTVLSNGLTDLTGKFDQVITNPPFHTGIKTDYAVTEGFIAQIKQFMQKSACLTLVANNFLKYQPLLQQQFGNFDTVAKNKRFTVYHAKLK